MTGTDASTLSASEHASRRAFLSESHVNPATWPPGAREAVDAANTRIRVAVTVRRHETGRQ